MDALIKKYLKIENFLNESERKLLSTACKVFLRSNKAGWDYQDGAQPFLYGDHLFDALMSEKIKLMQEKTGLTLFPTYSFMKIYTKYSYLKKHIDRPACEYSVTVFIDSCNTCPWPIYIDGSPIYLNPGDGLVYKGCEFEHWREEYLGDWHAQCFLHYVNANGPHRDHILDKRKTLGEQKPQIRTN